MGVNGPDAIDCPTDTLPELGGKDHPTSLSRGGVVDCAFRDRYPEHLLKAHGLGANLEVGVPVGLAPADLVLDWKRRLPVELDHVGLTDEAEFVGPDSDRALDSNAILGGR